MKLARSSITSLVIYFVLATQVSAQVDASRDTLAINFKGYIKALNGIIYSKPLSSLTPYFVDNLVHNRLDLEMRYGATWKVELGMRNRMFWGDILRTDATFPQGIEDANNDQWDLSAHIIDKSGFLVNSYFDRLNVQFAKDDLEITIGRQRINWGIHTFWNPNDLFNAYNFVDFDYEERPGTDALNVTKYVGFTGQMDLAIRYFENWDESIIAGRYVFGLASYDVQVIGGKFKDDYVIGAGWAGNLGTASLKGEWTYFYPQDDEKSDAFVASVGSEYVFENGLFLSGGLLYNSLGLTNGSSSSVFEFSLSPRNIYPYRWAAYVSGQLSLGALSGLSTSVIYSPIDTNPMFVILSANHSVQENWDLDLTTQWSLAKNDKYDLQATVAYLRLKWSF